MYYLPRRKPQNVYKTLYNSYGKSRIQKLGLPRTVKNIKQVFDYTR